jgi:aryl-alcohol dehydrogenase
LNRGVIQGESHPQEFIPRLVDFLMQGQMPVDRMMTFYPLADINRPRKSRPMGPRSSPCCACRTEAFDRVRL